MRLPLLAASLTLALSAVVSAAPAQLAPGQHWRPTCADHSCKSRVLVDATDKPVAAALPTGIGAGDVEKAYNVDVTLGSGVTVAVVDAYGYKDLETDLATYRSTFGLPPCSSASGCLTIVNSLGDPSPLPADDPDWITETALDVDMVSAGCPACKIVVVQSDAGGAALDIGQTAAVKLGVNTISNSWGSPEDDNVGAEEATFDNPGIGTFSGGGDNGFDSVQQGANGPTYPSTSLHVIAVGGTTMTLDGSTRGYHEVAWQYGGSSCSLNIAKPSFQPTQAACPMRAATDVSAVADGGTQGLAIYVAKEGGWTQVDGTSAASPLTASIFAASGHGDAVPAFVYKHPEAFLDITEGSNSGCSGVSNMCVAGAGWDGPTGLGTPDEQKLVAIGGAVGSGPGVTFTYPTDGESVVPGFTIELMPDADAQWVELDVDGVKLGAVNTAPYELLSPMSLTTGAHAITATAYDLDHNSKSTMINITLGAATSGDDDGNDSQNGCAAGGGGAGAGLGTLLALGAIVTRRKRG